MYRQIAITEVHAALVPELQWGDFCVLLATAPDGSRYRLDGFVRTASAASRVAEVERAGSIDLYEWTATSLMQRPVLNRPSTVPPT